MAQRDCKEDVRTGKWVGGEGDIGWECGADWLLVLLSSHGSIVVILGAACRTFDDRDDFFGAIRVGEFCVGEVMGGVDESARVIGEKGGVREGVSGK